MREVQQWAWLIALIFCLATIWATPASDQRAKEEAYRNQLREFRQQQGRRGHHNQHQPHHARHRSTERPEDPYRYAHQPSTNSSESQRKPDERYQEYLERFEQMRRERQNRVYAETRRRPPKKTTTSAGFRKAEVFKVQAQVEQDYLETNRIGSADSQWDQPRRIDNEIINSEKRREPHYKAEKERVEAEKKHKQQESLAKDVLARQREKDLRDWKELKERKTPAPRFTDPRYWTQKPIHHPFDKDEHYPPSHIHDHHRKHPPHLTHPWRPPILSNSIDQPLTYYNMVRTDELKEAVMRGETWVVLIYAPWCAHSRRAIAEFPNVAAQMSQVTGRRVSLAAFNVKNFEHAPVPHELYARYIPTVRLFAPEIHNADNYIEYDSMIQAKWLIPWIEEQTQALNMRRRHRHRRHHHHHQPHNPEE
ncbi:unnamed protein product, partial [Mesorhabditis spiculigera]